MVEGRENTQEKVAESEERVSGKEASEGKWSEEELAKFMVFLYFNKEIMCSKQQRRTLRIFKQMARFVETRSSIQCRSQHQKLMKKFKTTVRVLLNYQEKTGPERLKKACLLYCKHPYVKYLTREQPPKEKAGHAISHSTQTDFMSESFSSEQDIKAEESDLFLPNFYATVKKR